MATSLSIAIVLFLIIGGTYYFKNYKGKKKFEVTGPIVLYHTQNGIKFIEKLTALSPTFWKLFFGLGVFVGFLAMFLIFYTPRSWLSIRPAK